MSAKDNEDMLPEIGALRDRLTVDLTHIVGRLERLEDIAVLLAVEASRGSGQMGQPFYDFIDAIRAERKAWSS